jgi:putative heme uptake system protein
VSRLLLVCDAANIDMTLTQLLQERPTARQRPDYGVLAEWLLDRAEADTEVEACVFLTVNPGNTIPVRGWVMWLLERGYRVFAKPRTVEQDVDDDMVRHITARREEGDLRSLVVASTDARLFLEPLQEVADDGVDVTVLGFSEFSGALADAPPITFVDLEDIPGLFQSPLPYRIRLEQLPAEGRWFEPTGSLRRAATS